MITLSFLKFLESLEIFGKVDEKLFYQKLTLDNIGIYLTDIGDPTSNGSRDTQSYELLSRGKDDIDGRYKLSEIRKYLIDNRHNICEFPSVSIVIDKQSKVIPAYEKITILKPSTITNVGLDAQNRIIYSMTGTIIYKE